MDAVEQRHRLACLVRLELADQMQRHVRVGFAQGGPLGLNLLHPVLAEYPLALDDQRMDRLDRLGLADRDKGDVACLAPGELRRSGDPRVDLGERAKGTRGFGWIEHRALL